MNTITQNARRETLATGRVKASCPQCTSRWLAEGIEEGQRITCPACRYTFEFHSPSSPTRSLTCSDVLQAVSQESDGGDGLGERELPSNHRLTLEILNGPRKGRTLEINKSRITMGRGFEDMQFLDTQISRKHAVLEIYGDRAILLRDCASTNGTYVNDRPVSQTELKDGDLVRLGGVLGGTALKLRVREKSS
ncbi:MAG: FHA domain-containing protein [Acidobacteriota bacterium]|nr:MAG: FHA domain-containing protein [Acidobacteriota bacterium]